MVEAQRTLDPRRVGPLAGRRALLRAAVFRRGHRADLAVRVFEALCGVRRRFSRSGFAAPRQSGAVCEKHARSFGLFSKEGDLLALRPSARSGLVRVLRGWEAPGGLLFRPIQNAMWRGDVPQSGLCHRSLPDSRGAPSHRITERAAVHHDRFPNLEAAGKCPFRRLFAGAYAMSSSALQKLDGAPAPSEVLIIRPSRGWLRINFRELWQYRELLYFLVWRDIKVRYKQTALGAGWAIIQPLFTMLVFSLFFGRLAKVPSDGIPYPLFSYTALVPWTFFAQGLTQSSDSLVGSANLIKKIYFPRLAIPIGTVCAGMIDFALAFTVLLVLEFSYHIHPTAHILWLPLFVILALVTALGVGLWLSAFNVKYRDVKYVVPFFTQVWMFMTPIAYPSSLLSGKWRVIYGLNPMAGVVEAFRWALLGSKTAPSAMIGLSCAAAVTLLLGGAYYFRRMEKTFADVV